MCKSGSNEDLNFSDFSVCTFYNHSMTCQHTHSVTSMANEERHLKTLPSNTMSRACSNSRHIHLSTTFFKNTQQRNIKWGQTYLGVEVFCSSKASLVVCPGEGLHMMKLQTAHCRSLKTRTKTFMERFILALCGETTVSVLETAQTKKLFNLSITQNSTFISVRASIIFPTKCREKKLITHFRPPDILWGTLTIVYLLRS